MTSLFEYIKNLNSNDSRWGIWVNPEDIDDYRIGDLRHEDGGRLDDFIYIGTLEELSFGAQSIHEAIRSVLTSNAFSKNEYGYFKFKGREIKVRVDSVIDAYLNNSLDPDFHQALDSEIDYIWDKWASEEASQAIEDIEDAIASKLSEA